MKTKREKCWLKRRGWKQCCCNCVHHLPTATHYATTGKPHEAGKCTCYKPNGWACANPEMGLVFPGWPLHNPGCECYEAKKS